MGDKFKEVNIDDHIWYYEDVPGLTYSGAATNGKDSIAYAMHGYTNGAVYNYWLVHGDGNNQANKTFTEDCDTITSSNVAVSSVNYNFPSMTIISSLQL